MLNYPGVFSGLNLFGALCRKPLDVIVNQGRQPRCVLVADRKPVATDLRSNVLKMAAEGKTRKTIASQLSIGEATVYRILATQRDQKS